MNAQNQSVQYLAKNQKMKPNYDDLKKFLMKEYSSSQAH